MMRLKSFSLQREKISSADAYPFNVPAIRSLEKVDVTNRICFFVGENGSGKSTLLEAIAVHYGFGHEGGSRSFCRISSESVRTIDPLVRALRMGFTKRTGYGFYLRAESFFNNATFIDEMAADGAAASAYAPYGGKSLHEQSHGESFFSLLKHRFTRRGFYVIDEPEAALSPQRQLSLLVLLHDLLQNNDEIQFIIASHSPILLSYPGAQLLSFDGGHIHETECESTLPFQIYSRFFSNREGLFRELFSEQESKSGDVTDSNRRTRKHAKPLPLPW